MAAIDKHPVFELTGDENKHCINYGYPNKLTLIGIKNRSTLAYENIDKINYKEKAKKYNIKVLLTKPFLDKNFNTFDEYYNEAIKQKPDKESRDIYDLLKHLKPFIKVDEGFVLHFIKDKKIIKSAKFKFGEYLKIHKIYGNINDNLFLMNSILDDTIDDAFAQITINEEVKNFVSKKIKIFNEKIVTFSNIIIENLKPFKEQDKKTTGLYWQNNTEHHSTITPILRILSFDKNLLSADDELQTIAKIKTLLKKSLNKLSLVDAFLETDWNKIYNSNKEIKKSI